MHAWLMDAGPENKAPSVPFYQWWRHRNPN